MSTDAAVVAEEVVDQSTQDDDAGFADGFNLARGDEPPVTEAPPAAPVEEPAAEEKPPVEAPVEETVTLNQSEVKNLLSRLELLDKHQASIDKAHGRLGSLQETITKLQTAHASGETVELTDEDVADLKDYPEFAGSMKSVLGKVLSKVRGAPAQAFDAAPMQQAFEQKLIENEQKYEKKLLTVMRKDWNTVVHSDDFGLWLAGQDEAYRNQIGNSWDAIEIHEAIQKFEEAKAAKSAPPPTPPKTNTNKARLEAAVTPRGVRSPDTSTLDAEDAFAAGFKSGRGG